MKKMKSREEEIVLLMVHTTLLVTKKRDVCNKYIYTENRERERYMLRLSSGYSLKIHPQLWGQCGSYINEKCFFFTRNKQSRNVQGRRINNLRV